MPRTSTRGIFLYDVGGVDVDGNFENGMRKKKVGCWRTARRRITRRSGAMFALFV